MDQENVMSDWKLNRMKKSDIIAVLRETETKLSGYRQSAQDNAGQICVLNDNIDDHMIEEATLKKTIQELNESNKKLMDKIKFYQSQKEKNKKRDNKILEYFEKGMIEKLNIVDDKNKELEDEVARLEELSKQRFFENEKLKNENKELIEECKDKNKWNEKLQENYDLANNRLQNYMSYLHDMETAINNLRVTDEEILKAH
jgi:chromosome segregation ATPase